MARRRLARAPHGLRLPGVLVTRNEYRRELGRRAREAKVRCEDARRRRSEAVREAAIEARTSPRSNISLKVSGQEYNMEAGRHLEAVEAIRLLRGVA